MPEEYNICEIPKSDIEKYVEMIYALDIGHDDRAGEMKKFLRNYGKDIKKIQGNLGRHLNECFLCGDYYKEWAKERGYDSHWEYAKDAIKKKGYSSYAQYKRNLVEQNKKRPESKALSDLIKKRLVDLGETQFWLAHKINVSKITVSCYARGRCLPRNEILIRIFFALEVPYRTLDDLLEETN